MMRIHGKKEQQQQQVQCCIEAFDTTYGLEYNIQIEIQLYSDYFDFRTHPN